MNGKMHRDIKMLYTAAGTDERDAALTGDAGGNNMDLEHYMIDNEEKMDSTGAGEIRAGPTLQPITRASTAPSSTAGTRRPIRRPKYQDISNPTLSMNVGEVRPRLTSTSALS